jgi:hypothetical protein
MVWLFGSMEITSGFERCLDVDGESASVLKRFAMAWLA